MNGAEATNTRVGEALRARLPGTPVLVPAGLIALGALCLAAGRLPAGLALGLVGAVLALRGREGLPGRVGRGDLRPPFVFVLAGGVLVLELLQPMDLGGSIVFAAVALVVAALGVVAVSRANLLR